VFREASHAVFTSSLAYSGRYFAEPGPLVTICPRCRTVSTFGANRARSRASTFKPLRYQGGLAVIFEYRQNCPRLFIFSTISSDRRVDGKFLLPAPFTCSSMGLPALVPFLLGGLQK